MLRPKGPLRKPGAAQTTATSCTTSSLGTSAAEKASSARGALALGAPPPPSGKKTSSTQAVSQFNSRQERSAFLDSAYMERRAEALRAMRQGASA